MGTAQSGQIHRLAATCVRHGRRDLFAPAVFVLCLFGAWFAGELYAVSALVWFFLGGIDRQLADEDDVVDGDFDASSYATDDGDLIEPNGAQPTAATVGGRGEGTI